MSTGAPATREDLTAPATKADLLVVKGDLKSMKVDLGSQIKSMKVDLESQIKLLKSDLEGQIKDVARDLRGEMANLQVSLGRTIWIAIATLGAVGIILQFFP